MKPNCKPHLPVLASLLLSAPLLAQWPTAPGVPGQQDPTQPQGQQGQQQQPQQPDPFGYDAFNRPFMPFETALAPDQGFPTFAPGIYPPAPKDWMKPPVFGAEPRSLPLLPTNPDWPSWLKSRLDRELPYAPDKAVLVRDADRVWLRTPEEAVFVPLYFFDKLRAVGAGTAIEVRQTGSFQLVFHGGSRLVSRGTAALEIVAMDDKQLRLELQRLTRVELICFGRAHSLLLPDGSELLVEAADPSAGRAEIRIERQDEPGWFGGRACLYNSGLRPVRWHTAFGDQVLEPGFRATMFLLPSPHPIAAPLQHEAVSLQQVGTALQAEPAGANASLSWMGARFSIPVGGRLAIDPLLGDPFADKPAAAPAAGQPPSKPPPNIQPPNKQL